MCLFDYYLPQGTKYLGVDNHGLYKFDWGGIQFLVTDKHKNQDGSWHVRVTSKQLETLNSLKIAYENLKHLDASLKTSVGGPSHLFGVPGEAVKWYDTQDLPVQRKPLDASVEPRGGITPVVTSRETKAVE